MKPGEEEKTKTNARRIPAILLIITFLPSWQITLRTKQKTPHPDLRYGVGDGWYPFRPLAEVFSCGVYQQNFMGNDDTLHGLRSSSGFFEQPLVNGWPPVSAELFFIKYKRIWPSERREDRRLALNPHLGDGLKNHRMPWSIQRAGNEWCPELVCRDPFFYGLDNWLDDIFKNHINNWYSYLLFFPKLTDPVTSRELFSKKIPVFSISHGKEITVFSD